MSANAWRLKRVIQCAKCPWRTTTDPREIPNGYCERKHAALAVTIAEPGDVRALFSSGPQRAMACHEDHDAHCIGWLKNQIGAGNNIGLRMRMMSCENSDQIRVIGEQHETFEETLPQD